ncbi:MAG: sporulation protein Cse60 [Bacilli bacterium]
MTVIKLKVKVIDEAHELDLEESINRFITEGADIIDIKFQTAVQIVGEEQVYCFTALIMYE